MTWAILKDAELGIAALVALDPPLALGPTAGGETVGEAEQVLREFVTLLEREPDEMPFGHLWEEWRAYVDAIVKLVDDAVAERDAGNGALGEAGELAELAAGGDHPAGGGGAPDAGTGGEPLPAEPHVDHEGERQELDERDELYEGELDELDVDPVELASRLASVPGGTPAQRELATCWLCNGDGTLEGPAGVIDCSICGGAGSLPADHPTLIERQEA